MTNFLIIEDHPSIIMGVKLMISSIIPGAKFKEFQELPPALKHLKTHAYDLIILDIGIPGGHNLGMIDQIKQLQKDVLILVYSGYDDSIYAVPYITAGADGYLTKNSSEKDFTEAIRSLIKNRKYLSLATQQQLINSVKTYKSDNLNPIGRLTDREIEIMNLILLGNSSKEISNITNLKMSTISTFKLHILKKMEVNNMIDLYKKVEILK
jgi:two-component system invasion response regulator UvrY